MIEPLRSSHVKAVSELHCATLPGLLSYLGTAAAEAFYAGCVRTKLAIGLVYLDDAKVSAFILGSPHPDLLKRDVLRKNSIDTLKSLAMAIVARPSAAGWLLKSFRGPDEGSLDPRAPELIYLTVSEQSRGGGIATTLVNAFNGRMRAEGVNAYELSVDEGNRTAIAFYERFGFHLIGHYRQFGIQHRRYKLVLR